MIERERDSSQKLGRIDDENVRPSAKERERGSEGGRGHAKEVYAFRRN